MEMNIIMVDTVHFDMGAWCIITVCGVSAWIHKQFYRGEVVFSGTLYVEGGCPSLIADAMGKGIFHIIFFKTQRFFILDKCILKVKINPMRSSGFHAICRIKLMMTAFLATLYTSTVKL